MRKIRIIIPVVFILFSGMISCSKMDDPIKPFIKGGEIIYSTKVDSLKSYSGRNRALLRWEFPANHSAKRIFAYWNKDQDSIELDFKHDKGKIYEALINDLDEATYLFDIYSFDIDNNRSIKTLTSVNVYGERYESSLLNRVISKAELDANQHVKISFANAEPENVATEVSYISVDNKEKKISIDNTENTVTISDWKLGTPITYQSSYKPQNDAVDIFYVKQAETIKIAEDVSSKFLKNYGQPFLAVQDENRFRDPLHWKVNSAVQNQGGRGGWSTDDGTVLAMESGWGARDITNGKIFQTINLPKGNYSLKIDLLGFDVSSSQAFILAVPGSSLPDFDVNLKVPTAYGMEKLELKEFEFTVPSGGSVSIGFLANMIGDQYWRVQKVTLYKYY